MQMCPNCSANNNDWARFCIRCGTPLRRLRGRGTILQRRYRLERVLGCGGMGAVYFATDLALGISVAVKENLDSTPEGIRQFETEAHILAGLRHPNLPRVQDFFSANNRQYLVMDFISGESLEDVVEKKGSLPSEEVMRWLGQIMEAVSYLHSQKPPIIHRDIKPANIKLCSDGRAYLVDFGIAKQLQIGTRTQAGARAVTAGYSPPEQYGTAPTDQRSDIYSLGATLYFALTGRVPPEAIERVTGKTDKLIPPRSINPFVPAALEKVILRAMRVNREERYNSVADMLTDLTEQAVHRPSVTRQPAMRPPVQLPTGQALAPSWARLLAFLVDFVIIAAAIWLLTLGYLVISAVISANLAGSVFWVQPELSGFLAAAFLWVFPIYRILGHSIGGQTMGKALFGLRVINRQGKSCGLGRVLAREIALWSQTVLCCGFGLLWAVFDPYKQGWHDLLAGTFVIREQTEEGD